ASGGAVVRVLPAVPRVGDPPYDVVPVPPPAVMHPLAASPHGPIPPAAQAWRAPPVGSGLLSLGVVSHVPATERSARATGAGLVVLSCEPDRRRKQETRYGT